MTGPAPHITRLAPSPTGALHLGNARTFLVNWLMARQNGWRILLRVEDLDGPRIKPHADLQLINDLRWLGIDWDEPPLYQSTRLATYDAVVEQLVSARLAYPCVCSRREVDLAASAPHAEDGATVYPGTCRGRFATVADALATTGRMPAIRFRVDTSDLTFDDGFASSDRRETIGEAGSTTGTYRHICRPASDLGDFVIRKSDGTAAYQLAVVVDDAAAGVTDIVRGDDLLDSTPRQIMLYRALGLAGRLPRYWHLPLVVGEDGRRLAKRHGDTRLATYRQAGIQAGDILALLARWCGMVLPPSIHSAPDLVGRLDLAQLPRGPIVFTPGDLVLR